MSHDIHHDTPAPTLEEIWRLFKETDRLIKEQARETDRLLKQEAERRAQDDLRRAQEEERRSQELDRRFKETDKKIGDLGNRLGDFVEGFVAPAAVRLFQERGMDVSGLSRDMQRSNAKLGLAAQIDLLVVNGDSCIAIEVKSSLSVDDVNEHVERLEKFKPLFHEYRDKKIYGAVAGMVIPPDTAKYAYRKGFFVIGQKGDTVVILNDEKFKPAAW